VITRNAAFSRASDCSAVKSFRHSDFGIAHSPWVLKCEVPTARRDRAARLKLSSIYEVDPPYVTILCCASFHNGGNAVTQDPDMKEFLAEFETLKAKYGEAFADLKVVRFTAKGEIVRGWRDFVPYWCRTDDDGVTTCEEERPI
jgi:hypothetical protein